MDIVTTGVNFRHTADVKLKKNISFREIEEKNLIYNFDPKYVGKKDINWTFQQAYLFHWSVLFIKLDGQINLFITQFFFKFNQYNVGE